MTHLATTGQNSPATAAWSRRWLSQQISQPGAGVFAASADPGAQLAEVAMPGQPISEPRAEIQPATGYWPEQQAR
jgi:hypothetical protein